MTDFPVHPDAIAIVSGSGLVLEPIFDDIQWQRPFAHFPQLPHGAVIGHQHTFTAGRTGSRNIILQAGRIHVYEGHSPQTAARTVDILHAMGARAIIFTNAAGGLIPSLAPGTLLAVTHIHLWPYCHWEEQPPALTTDFTLPGFPCQGAYTWVHGPCYETPAEIAALRQTGAAAVGMSTAPELARCKALNIPAAVISCITNACGASHPLTHQHVIQTAAKASTQVIHQLRQTLNQI